MIPSKSAMREGRISQWELPFFDELAILMNEKKHMH